VPSANIVVIVTEGTSIQEAPPGRRPGQLPAGRHGLSREFVARNQHERLLDGMATAVAEKGYLATTVADVLEVSGVSRRTFYENFKDKEDCFLRAYEAIVERISARVDEVYARSGTWAERVHAGLAAFLDFIDREPAFAKLALVDSLAAGPRALETYEATVQHFRRIFEEGREHSPFAGELTDTVSQAVVSGIVGVLYDLILKGGDETASGLLEDLTYFALVPYQGHDGAKRTAAEPAVPPSVRPAPGARRTGSSGAAFRGAPRSLRG
jgi:AcrR family transcriptional regulator